MEPQTAILVAAGLATAGWLYTGRRARVLSKKQHTINVLLQASFNKEFLAARNAIGPHLSSGTFPETAMMGEDEQLRAHFRSVLNHFEFVAAAIRNGDLDERLIRDSERMSYMIIFECCENYIWHLRNSRARMTIYEHLEWLYDRWGTPLPSWQRVLEKFKDAPFYGRSNGSKQKSS